MCDRITNETKFNFIGNKNFQIQIQRKKVVRVIGKNKKLSYFRKYFIISVNNYVIDNTHKRILEVYYTVFIKLVKIKI